MRLDPDSLEVSSFEMQNADVGDDTGGGGYCCTGCVSGCGINPTAGGCQSQPKTWEYVTCGNDGTIAFEAAAAE